MFCGECHFIKCISFTFPAAPRPAGPFPLPDGERNEPCGFRPPGRGWPAGSWAGGRGRPPPDICPMRCGDCCRRGGNGRGQRRVCSRGSAPRPHSPYPPHRDWPWRRNIQNGLDGGIHPEECCGARFFIMSILFPKFTVESILYFPPMCKLSYCRYDFFLYDSY